MQIRYHCPTDDCVAIIEYEPLEGCGATMRCPRCGVEHPMTITPAVREENHVDVCTVCAGQELFVRKDFPQHLGVAIVVVFGLVAVYAFTVSVVIAWGVLILAALIDLVIYGLAGQVTTCYACRAEYRKCALNATHEDFDLATSEKY